MKALFSVLVMLALACSGAVGQRESGGCELCASVETTSCNGFTHCPGSGLWATYSFTAPCTDSYTFRARLQDCASGHSVYQCIGCAELRDSNGNLVQSGSITLVDDGWGCEEPYDRYTSVGLSQGQSYTIYVRMGRCPVTTTSCSQCVCKLKARVYGDDGDCTAW